MNKFLAQLLSRKNLKSLKELCAIFFWLSAYLAMFSLFTHLFSIVWVLLAEHPFPSLLAFIPASAFMVFVLVRMFSAFWWGVRK